MGAARAPKMAAPTTDRVLLEALLYFSRLFVFFYWFVGNIMFVFKGLNLPYPTGTIIGEMILLTVICIIDANRIFLASRGNKTEKTPPMAWSLLLCLFAFGGYLYMAIGQVYVLRLELIANGVSLGLVGLGFLSTLWTMMGLSSN